MNEIDSRIKDRFIRAEKILGIKMNKTMVTENLLLLTELLISVVERMKSITVIGYHGKVTN